MKNQARRHQNRFKATNSGTSKLTLWVSFSAACESDAEAGEDARTSKKPVRKEGG
jgi:hypothetical protein